MASIQLLSDDRHVNVSALAGAHEGSTTSSDSRVAMPFLDFHPNITAHALWMDSMPPPGGLIPETAESDAAASQDSILSATDMFCHSFIEVGAEGNGAGPFEVVNADALSFFQVSFSVSTPIVFNLSLFDARGYITAVGATYEQAFDLTSDTSGSILGLPVMIGDTKFYTGLLQPGETYTLLLSQHANTIIPSPTGTHVANTLEAHMTFLDVPEPSVFLSVLFGFVLLGIARLKLSRPIPCAKRASD